jgi:aspartate aminotransferase
MKIADRMAQMRPSPTLAVAARADALRSKGIDVVAFGLGEPDFDTPANIKQAAVAALARGAGKYTAVPGTPSLRSAVAEELNRVHGTRHAADNVIVSVGAKHSLYNLFMAMLDTGDEVVIPSPCWVSYPDLVSMAAGTPVLVPTSADQDFALKEAALERAITPRTRAIVLNSPCNPTGAVYDEASLEGVGRVLDRHPQVMLIADDIYRRLVYDGTWTTLSRVRPDLVDRMILIDGVSKSYAMTGWRIGYCAGPRELVKAMSTLQGQSTTNPSAVAQAAALEALTGPQESVEVMRQEFDRRRVVMIEGLRAIPKVRLSAPRGAFYCFPDLSSYLGARCKDDLELADWLLDRGRVAVVPGSGFAAPGFVRLSYAVSMAQVEEGVRRIAGALAEL